MAWRAIQDTVGRSISLATISSDAERLYFRMLGHSSPWGRLNGHPLKLRALCYPLLGWTDAEVGGFLEELVDVGRAIVYATDDGLWIQLVDFDENQPKEAYKSRGTSKIPAPPDSTDCGEGLIARYFGSSPKSSDATGETPANGAQLRSGSELLRSPRRNAGRDKTETETRPDLEGPSSSSDARASNADEPHDDDALEAKITRLEQAGWHPAPLERARTDIDRAIAWLDHHQANPDAQKPGALALVDFDRGTAWPPTPRDARAPGAYAGTRSTSPPLPDRPPADDLERIAPPPDFLALAGHTPPPPLPPSPKDDA